MLQPGRKAAFVGTFTSSRRVLGLFGSEFTNCAVRSSRLACVLCTTGYRSRLIRHRISATSAERTHGSQSVSVQGAQRRLKGKRLALIGIFFLLVTYLWSFVFFVPMLIAHPLVLLRDRVRRRFHDFMAVSWMKVSFFTVGIRTRVLNSELLPPEGVPVVYVANHTSFLDVYSLAYLKRRMKYLAKSELFRLPIVGWAMAMTGNVSVKRMTRRGQVDAYRKMLAVIRNGTSLAIYPEGTRSATGKLRRFHSGAFRTAKQQGVPVVPVTILGTREIMPSDAWVPLRYPTAPITLVVHSPLDSSKHSVEELRDLAFRAIDSALPPELQTGQVPSNK